MNEVGIIIDADFTVSEIDRRLFGSFVEHMGRCVYTGIYEPDHPTADAHGFRGDVLELVRELGPTIVRYPGGNFMSGYRWEDSVGPVEQRPRQVDLAWLSTETNEFGVNEFIDWCKLAQTEPMLGVNLGTRGPDDARAFIEYCNHPGGTALSELRAAHGYKEPHGVKFWCLGNEMDGVWQTGQKTPYEYGRIAREAGKTMKWVDPTIQVSACGSSYPTMTTFGSWEYEVLDHTYDVTDFVSLHMYYLNPYNDVQEFLSNVDVMDRYIRDAVAVCDAVGAKQKSLKRIMLSFDEWNVWYKARAESDLAKPGWPVAPRLLEEIYDLQDALMVGGALITLLNHADRVKSACLAQLVNVIGAIFTEPGGEAWRQTIFHPFKLVAQHARGTVLQTRVRSGQFETKQAGTIDHVVASAVHDVDQRKVALYILNREASGETAAAIDLRGFPQITGCEAVEMAGTNLLATNAAPPHDAVQPSKHKNFSVQPDKVTVTLQPLSWSQILLRY